MMLDESPVYSQSFQLLLKCLSKISEQSIISKDNDFDISVDESGLFEDLYNDSKHVKEAWSRPKGQGLCVSQSEVESFEQQRSMAQAGRQKGSSVTSPSINWSCTSPRADIIKTKCIFRPNHKENKDWHCRREEGVYGFRAQADGHNGSSVTSPSLNWSPTSSRADTIKTKCVFRPNREENKDWHYRREEGIYDFRAQADGHNGSSVTSPSLNWSPTSSRADIIKTKCVFRPNGEENKDRPCRRREEKIYGFRHPSVETPYFTSKSAPQPLKLYLQGPLPDGSKNDKRMTALMENIRKIEILNDTDFWISLTSLRRGGADATDGIKTTCNDAVPTENCITFADSMAELLYRVGHKVISVNTSETGTSRAQMQEELTQVSQSSSGTDTLGPQASVACDCHFCTSSAPSLCHIAVQVEDNKPSTVDVPQFMSKPLEEFIKLNFQDQPPVGSQGDKSMDSYIKETCMSIGDSLVQELLDQVEDTITAPSTCESSKAKLKITQRNEMTQSSGSDFSLRPRKTAACNSHGFCASTSSPSLCHIAVQVEDKKFSCGDSPPNTSVGVHKGKEWIGGVRALRDLHVRLVLRQLRYIDRMNHALEGVPRSKYQNKKNQK